MIGLAALLVVKAVDGAGPWPVFAGGQSTIGWAAAWLDPAATAEPDLETSLAALAPAVGPDETRAAATAEAPPAPTDLDALISPAAGPLDLAGAPLEAEPFLEERRELARQQEAMAVRQTALGVAEARLREHIERLEALSAEVEAQLAELQAADEERLVGLVKLYEKMRPKSAAAIFDALAFDVLVPLTLRMKEAKLAPILAAMEPRVARRLTAELARARADEATLQVAVPVTAPGS
ncbi:MAG: hypothetical protein AAFX81_08210 [Pseudomonadota bacterium]